MNIASTFSGIAAFLLFPGLLVSCKNYKDYSYEGGTAVYSFVGAGGACTSSLVHGSYVPSLALNSSNTVQLQVNVSLIGTYSINTNSADGIAFTASGKFTVLGVQTINLIGKGKPVAAGNFLFQTPGASGCTFNINVAQKLAQYTLEGAPGVCSAFVVNGMYVAGTTLTAGYTVSVKVDVATPAAYSISTDTLDGIYFSAAGNFTNTGIQTIELQGFGTPTIPDALNFTTNTGFSACTFSLVVVTAQPAATYVLESNQDGSCSAYLVSGEFFSGQPLSGANRMALKVTVTVMGNYAVNTNTVDGFRFTGFGTFGITGPQLIELTASGTPFQKGIFSLTPMIIGPHPIGGNECNTSIEVK
jgi:hypothetical protein